MKIMVAMSGGVDSSAAVAFLLQQGHEVAGATFLLCEPLSLSPEEAAKHSPAVRDAKDICTQLGIPHYTLDLRCRFEEKVRLPFVEGYLAGTTPNPCVDCNKYIKFPAFWDFAREKGYDRIATGHYAFISRGEDGISRLKKAHSLEKDQSYMLYNLTGELLNCIELPLGSYTKGEIRAFAAELGLAVSTKPDSQDICFIPDKNAGSYIASYLEQMGISLPAGSFIDSEGKELGPHKGIWNYTLGQHKKLGIALGSPRYVSAIDPAKNTVTLVENEQLIFSKIAFARDVNLLHPNEYPGKFRANVKPRYGKREAAAVIYPPEDNSGLFCVEFEEPQRALTPGQSLVFYNGDELIGGGVCVLK